MIKFIVRNAGAMTGIIVRNEGGVMEKIQRKRRQLDANTRRGNAPGASEARAKPMDNLPGHPCRTLLAIAKLPRI